MPEEQTIKYTLDVIRKALEEDEIADTDLIDENILILDQLVSDDGKIKSVKDSNLKKNETLNILDSKLDQIFNEHLTKWLDKNIPLYLEKYFKNKKI
tara:strand:+ start:334 stop:624 length:291 start_codon:yes stop_codon:yes gene_type:complete